MTSAIRDASVHTISSASRFSTNPSSHQHASARAGCLGSLVNTFGKGNVFDANSERLEERNLFGRLPSRHQPGGNVSQFVNMGPFKKTCGDEFGIFPRLHARL